MPRTIESIISNHKEAASRRAAGKPIWDHTVKFKDLLSLETPSPAEISEKGKLVASRIEKGIPKAWIEPGEEMDFELEDVLLGLKWIVTEDDPKEGLIAIEEFNGYLDQFYDWADGRRVKVS